VRDAFTLDPGTIHLNHGSFGAVPRVVQEEQRRVMERVDSNPMRFYKVLQADCVRRAREVAGELLGVSGDDLALVRNVTEATTVVMRTLVRTGRLTPQDVVLVSDHGYGAVRLCLEQWCRRYGAQLQVLTVPLACADIDVVDLHRAAMERVAAQGQRVALVVVDAVTSPTGVLQPVTELTRLARGLGAVSFVDAAHAPGHLDVSPAGSGADLWAGAFHKWGFASRGTSALWVSEPLRDQVHPASTSWNRDEPFPVSFDWRGTDDYSGWLALDAAARFWRDIGGFDAVEQRRKMLDEMTTMVASSVPPPPDQTEVPVQPAPCLRLVPLPEGVADTVESADAVYAALSRRCLEVQVVPWGGRGFVRLSAAPYNEPGDYERLAAALPEVLG
jgi:isopenicillin-N epimerase